MTDPFYLSPRWIRLRKVILRRDGYVCQYFKRYGKTVEAKTVHHIFPRQEYPEYEWQAWNLISLSYEAHMMMHGEGGALTDEGMKLATRVALRVGVSPPGSGRGAHQT